MYRTDVYFWLFKSACKFKKKKILYKKKHFSFVTSWSVSFLIQHMRSCAEQPFTVYACAGHGQIHSRNFSECRKAALICAPVMLHQQLLASWYLFFCVCCDCAECLPHKWHVREWLQCNHNVVCTRSHFWKNRPKKRQKKWPVADRAL